MDKNISQIVMNNEDSADVDFLDVYFSKTLSDDELDFDKRLQTLRTKGILFLLLFSVLAWLVFGTGIFIATKIDVNVSLGFSIPALLSLIYFYNSVSVKLNDKMFAIEEEKERLEKTEVSTVSLNEEHLNSINSLGEHFVHDVNIVLASATSQKQQADKILKTLVDIEELAPLSDKNKTDAKKMELLGCLVFVLNSYDKDFKEKQLIKEEDAETFAANDFIIENLAKQTKIELGF